MQSMRSGHRRVTGVDASPVTSMNYVQGVYAFCNDFNVISKTYYRDTVAQSNKHSLRAEACSHCLPDNAGVTTAKKREYLK